MPTDLVDYDAHYVDLIILMKASLQSLEIGSDKFAAFIRSLIRSRGILELGVCCRHVPVINLLQGRSAIV